MPEQVIIEFVADTTKLEEAYNKITSQISDSSTLNKDSAMAFQKANADAAQSFTDASDRAKKLHDQLRNISSVITGGALRNLTKQLNDLNDIQIKATGGVKTLSAQLAEAKGKFTELSDAGKKNTHEYIAQQKEVERLSSVMKHLQQAVSSLNDETKELNGLATMSNEAASGFESAAKAAQKTVSQTGEVEAMYARIENAVKTVKTAMDDYEVATKAVTKAKWLEEEATKAVMAASDFFTNASIKGWAAATGGVTLLVAGIVELISYFQQMNDEEEAHKTIIDAINTRYDTLIKKLQQQKEILQALGVSTLNIDEQQQQEIIKKNNEIVNRIVAELNKKVKAVAEGEEGGDSFLAQIYMSKPTPINEMTDFITDEQRKQFNDALNAIKDAQQKIKVITASTTKQISEIYDKGDKEEADAAKANLETKLALYEQFREKKRDQMVLDGAEAKKLREFDESTLEGHLYLERKIAQQEQDSYEQSRTAQAERMNGQIALLKESKDTERAEALAYELRKYNDNTYAQLEKMKTKATKDESDKRMAFRKKEAEDEHQEILKRVADAKAAEVASPKQEAIDDNTPTKLPTTDVQNNQRDEAAKAKDIDAQRLATMQQFNISREQIDKDYMAFVDETGETDYNKFIEREKKKLQTARDTDKQIATASVNFAKQAADQIFDVANKNRNQRYNDEISTLQKQSQFELDNNNLTQAQKIAIQRKFDKEVAAVKLQQWKADQKSKEEQAIINGALAITNILATMPQFDFGIAQGIAIAASVASTATSVATIAAQKPPAFAKGTPTGAPDTPTGMKLVGEHGPELIYTPGGERIITAPDTAALLAKYDVPALPTVSPDIMLKANVNQNWPLINEKSLAKEIAAEMSKQTKPLIQFDKNGFTAHLVSKGSKRTVLNNKNAWD